MSRTKETVVFNFDPAALAVGKRQPLYTTGESGIKADEVVVQQPAKPKISKSKRYICKLSVTKACFICQGSFTAKRVDALFCSPKCRMKAMRENHQLKMAM